MPVRRKRIRTTACEILDKFGITEPPVSIKQIAEKLGVKLQFQPLESDLSGIMYSSGENSIIGVNDYHPQTRQNFTIAHELGHFLLHQNEVLRVDHAAHAKFRNSLSSKGINAEEVEANLFAAEILMPQQFISADLENSSIVDILDDDFINQLAKRYDVSTQALLIRLIRLGYIEEQDYSDSQKF